LQWVARTSAGAVLENGSVGSRRLTRCWARPY
jgi:hypothetical protein